VLLAEDLEGLRSVLGATSSCASYGGARRPRTGRPGLRSPGRHFHDAHFQFVFVFFARRVQGVRYVVRELQVAATEPSLFLRDVPRT